ncbi:Flp pilus assembly protein CpaB [Myxococcota bacterium]|nr:Flp pilus assembly protein CpaB [Myxococcota bacterium]
MKLFLLGLFLCFGCAKQVSEKKQEPEKISSVTVLVAKKDLAVGEILSAEKVEFKKMPAGFGVKSLLRSDDFVRFNKRPLASAVPRGELLLASFFKKPAPPVGSKVRVGGRSYPINISGVGLHDQFSPGTHLDVIAVYTTDDEEKKEVVAATIIENVVVLGSTERCPQNGRCNATVSVLVLPEEVEKIALAETLGQVRLAVRNAEDRSIIRLTRLTTRGSLKNGEQAKVLRAGKRVLSPTVKILKRAPKADSATPPMKAAITIR